MIPLARSDKKKNFQPKEFVSLIYPNIEFSDQEIKVNKLFDFENTPIITSISLKKQISSLKDQKINKFIVH